MTQADKIEVRDIVRTFFWLVASSLAFGVVGAGAQSPTPGHSRPPSAVVNARTGPVKMLAGTKKSVLTTIQGNALNENDGALADAPVRLRDARIGRIVDTETTDKTGLFTFHDVDPGTYVVEVVGNDSTVLATSQVLSVNAGEVISTLV